VDWSKAIYLPTSGIDLTKAISYQSQASMQGRKIVRMDTPTGRPCAILVDLGQKTACRNGVHSRIL
jgi:hypothetical protein